MAKRNIEVKEKNLIEKMNETIRAKEKADVNARLSEAKEKYESPTTYVWDNNGPIQFDSSNEQKWDVHVDTATDKDHTDVTIYKVGKNFEGVNEDKFFNEDVNVQPNTVCLTPRNPDGTFMENYDETECNLQDNADSRASLKKNMDMKYIEKLRESIEEKRIAKDPVKVKALAKAVAKEMDTQLRTPDSDKEYEYVNHPKHYNNYGTEVIDMMQKVFGTEATYNFCVLNAFKYRMRAGTKPNIAVQQDLDKEQWYLNKAAELKKALDNLR
jgi:hypothetical protein